MTPTPRLDALGLVVADLAAALAFYRQLGLPVPADADDSHVEVPLPGGPRLMFDTIDVIQSFDPAWTPPVGGHRVALAFACATPSEVDSIFAAMAGYGHVEPFDAPWGQRYATLHDPDGNAVELFAPLS